MKNFENTGRMKKAGPTLTPDGKTLVGGKCPCGKACRNRDDGGGFCRCSHHEAEYRRIAELLGEVRTEQLRRDMDSLLTGPGRGKLTNFALSLTKNLAEAEELVQAACVKALHYGAGYDSRRSLSGWLMTILRNDLYDGRRHSRLNVSLDHEGDADDGFSLGDTLVGPDLPIEFRMEREGETAALWQAVSEIPKPARHIVSLCHVEGMTYEDAAARLRIPLGTVRSRLSRGHRVLRERFHSLTNSVNGGTYERALQPV